MQKIKYTLCQLINVGTEEEPKYEEILYGKTMPYSETNLKFIETEAYNGEYEIYDDGQPDPADIPTIEDRFEALETAMAILYMPDVNELN